jgi:hypothetical protein
MGQKVSAFQRIVIGRRAVEMFLKGYWEISTLTEWHWGKETFARTQRNVDYQSGTFQIDKLSE